jgi:hypothetical protein
MPMTIAEMKGKLWPESVHDRSEDLLTSDVFGTMHFVSDAVPFFVWLAQAVSVFGTERTLATILPTQAFATVQIRFWPRLQNRRKPDVAILASNPAFKRVSGIIYIAVICVPAISLHQRARIHRQHAHECLPFDFAPSQLDCLH